MDRDSQMDFRLRNDLESPARLLNLGSEKLDPYKAIPCSTFTQWFLQPAAETFFLQAWV